METKSKGYNLSIPVNGIHLSYDDVGEGKIPIIFLHGFPFDKSSWELQLEFLKFTYRLIAIGIRGFGESIDEDSTLSIDLFADDLIQFMDELKIEKAIICGLSMGGYIVLNAQKRFPERFTALILADTQCIADTPEVKKNRYKTIDEIEANGLVDFTEGFTKKVFHPESLTNKKEVVEDLRRVIFSNSQSSIVRGLAALAERSETCSTLRNISIPTLIICGDEDQVTPIEKSESMKSSIAGSKLAVIENAGHVSNLEQPHEFAKALSDFLAELD